MPLFDEVGPILTQSPAPLSAEQFREGLESVEIYETNLLTRVRIRRVLRNDRLFERVLRAVNASGVIASVPVFKGDFLDWFIEHWDEILKILLTVLPLFI